MNSLMGGVADGINVREEAYELNIPQLEPMDHCIQIPRRRSTCESCKVYQEIVDALRRAPSFESARPIVNVPLGTGRLCGKKVVSKT